MKNTRKSSYYYDFTERLSFFWTCIILLALPLGVLILRIVFLKSIISCWTPAHFTGPHVEYTHQRCWADSQFYLPMDPTSPPADESMPPGLMDAFHSWIPVVVICMIIGFKIPQMVKCILELSFGEPSVIPACNSDSSKDTCLVLVRCVKESVQRSGVIRFFTMFFVKFLVMVNLVVQFVFVKSYFKDFVKSEMVGNVTIETPVQMFPKTVLCDFEIRQLNMIHRFTVHCDMPINHFYEEYIRMLGFWILAVIIVTGLTFIFQFSTLVIPPLVKLRFRGIIPENELNLRGCAVDDALLFLEDIRDQFGVAIAREVATKLWESPKVSNTASVPSAPTQVGYGYTGIPMTAIQTTNPASNSSASPLLYENTVAKPMIQ